MMQQRGRFFSWGLLSHPYHTDRAAVFHAGRGGSAVGAGQGSAAVGPATGLGARFGASGGIQPNHFAGETLRFLETTSR